MHLLVFSTEKRLARFLPAVGPAARTARPEHPLQSRSAGPARHDALNLGLMVLHDMELPRPKLIVVYNAGPQGIQKGEAPGEGPAGDALWVASQKPALSGIGPGG